MSKNKIARLLLILLVCIAAVFGIAAVAGCTSETVYYIVTFDSNGGSAVEAKVVESGAAVKKPDDPVKSGYEFDGWFTDEELTDENGYVFSTPVTGNITLYARWTEETQIVKYTVTFDVQGHGVAPAAQTVRENGKATKPGELSEAGYTFGGWYQDADCHHLFDFSSAITEDTTVYAKWTKIPDSAEEYTVTFMDRENVLDTVKVGSGKTVPEPSLLPREGYDFDGWYTEDDEKFVFTTAITEDITLTAKWTEKTATVTEYTITFDSNGGSAVEPIKVASGETATEPTAPTKENYDFDGWYTEDDEKFVFTMVITEDITLTAKWTEKTATVTEYTITFDSNGGSAVEPIKVASGETATEPTAPTKENYDFDGWYTEDDEKFVFTTVITEDITLTAKWTEKVVTPPAPEGYYTVTFNCNGGKIVDVTGEYEIKYAVVAKDTAVAEPDDPVRSGYDFVKWYTDTACTTEYVFTTEVTKDITLYAKWAPKTATTVTVTFDSDGGNKVLTQQVANGGKAIQPAAPAKAGYTFGGWYTDKECSDNAKFSFDTAVTTDITLYAKWISKTINPGDPDDPDDTVDDNATITYTYDYAAITKKTDGTKLTQADFTGVNEFLTVNGNNVTYRDNETSKNQTGPDCIENKEGGLSVTFEGKGKLTISFASTGGKNTSSLTLLDKDGNVVKGIKDFDIKEDDTIGNKAGAYAVTGTTATSVTFEITNPGEYTIYCLYYPDADTQPRGARIMGITMVETAEEAEDVEE